MLKLPHESRTKKKLTDDDRTKDYERYYGLNHCGKRLRLIFGRIRGCWQAREGEGRNEDRADTHLHMRKHSIVAVFKNSEIRTGPVEET